MRADTNGDGLLSYDEFRAFVGWTGHTDSAAVVSSDGLVGLGDEATFARLCRRFDPRQTGRISWAQFQRAGASWAVRHRSHLLRALGWAHENRVYLVFVGWLTMGVTWGVFDQGWDVITAAHFAVSALATGGLTAPPVNAEGIMPSDDAIFTGMYCFFGIPLFALVLTKVARALVENHILEAERRAIATPLQPADFELAKSLCTADDGYVHLTDFCLLHLLRQGKINLEGIRLMRAQFALYDKADEGRLTLEAACQMQTEPTMRSGRCTWPDV